MKCRQQQRIWAALYLGACTLKLESSHAFSSSKLVPSCFQPTFLNNRKRCPAFTSLALATDDDSTSSTMERLPNSAVEITLTATPSQTKSAYDKVITELSKEMSVPGFRKGAKIPPAVIENAIASRDGGEGKSVIREQAIQSLINDMVEHAIKEEHDLQPIGQPVLTVKVAELAKEYKPGESLEMKIRCDVWPDLEWKETAEEKPYFGLKGKYKRKPFNQERYDMALNDLRDRHVTLSPMDDPETTTLSMGDACVVNMEGFMAQDDGSKGEKLPDAASGDNVEVVLETGRYMEGLVEGLVGAKVGDTRQISVTFPTALRDKTLAGKAALFDVTVLEGSTRVLPELNDEFANKVRPGMTLSALEEELRKAVDQEDAKEFVEERNDALTKALEQVVEVDVPDTVVTQQAREKFAVMMTDFRNSGTSDEEIKKQITPENFLKYKKVVADDIMRDFKATMAVDEIAKLENVQVPANEVDEQLARVQKQAQEEGGEEASNFDPTLMRSKVESTLVRQKVFDFLAEKADLEVEYVEEKFDAELMKKLADDSLERERAMVEEAEAKAKEETA